VYILQGVTIWPSSLTMHMGINTV